MEKKDRKKVSSVEFEALKQDYLRALADYQNLEKRVIADRKKTEQEARLVFVRQFFPLFDDIVRANHHRPTKPSLKQYHQYIQGLDLIEQRLLKFLTEIGLSRIETVGRSFDHQLHEAISYEPNKTVPKDIIIGEVESGWLLDETVIRPAKVRVSQG